MAKSKYAVNRIKEIKSKQSSLIKRKQKPSDTEVDRLFFLKFRF